MQDEYADGFTAGYNHALDNLQFLINAHLDIQREGRDKDGDGKKMPYWKGYEAAIESARNIIADNPPHPMRIAHERKPS